MKLSEMKSHRYLLEEIRLAVYEKLYNTFNNICDMYDAEYHFARHKIYYSVFDNTMNLLAEINPTVDNVR